MLDFYRCYATNAKLQPLVAEIRWAKNLVIFSRCKDDLAREFYLRTAARPLGVATYTVVPQLPEDYRADLPSPGQIVERLKAWGLPEGNGE